MTRIFPDAAVPVRRDGGAPDAETEARLREALGGAFGAKAGAGATRGGDRIAGPSGSPRCATRAS